MSAYLSPIGFRKRILTLQEERPKINDRLRTLVLKQVCLKYFRKNPRWDMTLKTHSVRRAGTFLSIMKWYAKKADRCDWLLVEKKKESKKGTVSKLKLFCCQENKCWKQIRMVWKYAQKISRVSKMIFGLAIWISISWVWISCNDRVFLIFNV